MIPLLVGADKDVSTSIINLTVVSVTERGNYDFANNRSSNDYKTWFAEGQICYGI